MANLNLRDQYFGLLSLYWGLKWPLKFAESFALHTSQFLDNLRTRKELVL